MHMVVHRMVEELPGKQSVLPLTAALCVGGGIRSLM